MFSDTLVNGRSCANPQVREVRIDWREATGPSKARALAQALWAGEEYVLQIDSHMRFAQNWDARLLAWLHHAERSSRRGRAVLSCYPPPYEVFIPLDSCVCHVSAVRFSPIWCGDSSSGALFVAIAR